MTLADFFSYLGAHPYLVVGYFLLLPLVALFAGLMAKGVGHASPWKYLYAVIVFGVCIPGIFAIALSVYMFFFERRSVMDADVFTQVLPVISMFATLGLIRRNTSFDTIPGFGKISGLMVMIGAVFTLMYILDRTHLIAFVRVPVAYLLLIVVGLLLGFRFGVKMLFS